MKVQQVLNCSFSSWFPNFKNITIESNTIQLPQEFVDYLNADRVVLPQGSGQVQSRRTNIDDDYDDEEADWNTEDPDMPVAKAPEFVQLDDRIRKVINHFGGQVFPKLNWSSPKDAFWIAFDKTLKCTCPADIYLLLKSSNFISHDLSQPFDHCEDEEENGKIPVNYELILRKWCDLHPGMMFRCFVKNHRLIAISQRQDSQYYEFIKVQQNDIVADIQQFSQQKILGRFPDSDYVFDLYRQEKGILWLIDFGPFGHVTDPLLFSWKELTDEDGIFQNNEKLPIFRCVGESGIRPNPHAIYSLPQDVVDLSMGRDAYKLIDFLKLTAHSQNAESSDEDNET